MNNYFKYMVILLSTLLLFACDNQKQKQPDTPASDIQKTTQNIVYQLNNKTITLPAYQAESIGNYYHILLPTNLVLDEEEPNRDIIYDPKGSDFVLMRIEVYSADQNTEDYLVNNLPVFANAIGEDTHIIKEPINSSLDNISAWKIVHNKPYLYIIFNKENRWIRFTALSIDPKKLDDIREQMLKIAESMQFTTTEIPAQQIPEEGDATASSAQ